MREKHFSMEKQYLPLWTEEVYGPLGVHINVPTVLSCRSEWCHVCTSPFPGCRDLSPGDI